MPCKDCEDYISDGWMIMTIVLSIAIFVFLLMCWTDIDLVLEGTAEGYQKMGNAICDQEMNSTFNKYEDGKVLCHEVVSKRYDGLRVGNIGVSNG